VDLKHILELFFNCKNAAFVLRDSYQNLARLKRAEYRKMWNSKARLHFSLCLGFSGGHASQYYIKFMFIHLKAQGNNR
jgi:hypothetical protein